MNLLSFTRAIFRSQQIREAVAETELDYVGCEVLESVPGAFRGEYAVCIIASIQWDAEYTNYATGQKGEWLLGIRHIADGSQFHYYGTEGLTLTGTKYENIDAIRPIHPMYASAWQS